MSAEKTILLKSQSRTRGEDFLTKRCSTRKNNSLWTIKAVIQSYTDNAEMLASIEEIDGGLIALTRFQGEIGFYPEEYLEIIRLYLGE